MTAPRTWVVGEVVTAALMNQEIRDQFNSLLGAWTPYTPAWTYTSGTATPTYGNAGVVCRYKQVGRTVRFMMDITFGSTTVFGTGNWRFALPVPALVPSTRTPIGFASLFATNASKATAGLVTVDGSDNLIIFSSSANADATAAGGPVDSAHPFTWAAGDRLTATGTYETAA